MNDPLRLGSIYTAGRMNDFIGGKHQGGIRYSGHFPDLKHIAVIVGGGADAIYPDEVHGRTISYVGEGQHGDQRLSFGNRALVWAHLRDLPVHVFVNRGKNRYEYRGAHRVDAVSVVVTPDRDGADRGAFSFDLARRDG